MTPENDDPNPAPPSEYRLVVEDVDTSLDPDLQDIIIAERETELDPPPGGGGGGGNETMLGGGVEGNEPPVSMIDVIAELADPSQPVEWLNVEQRIGQIVTGTVRADKIKYVIRDPNVLSLKSARKLKANLGRSVREIEATQEQLHASLPAHLGEINGSGVVIGIIDSGCDFAHPNFLTEERKTRVKFLWDQHGGQSALSPANFPYGREFTAEQLNGALAAGTREEAYERLNYDPGERSHGTLVMDIAAGHGSNINGTKNPPGVAPKADIIFVDVAIDSVKDHQALGNSKHLLAAVKYIFEKAGAQPVVINISLSVNGGPHDGSSPVERGIDRLLRERDGRAVVIAAGNSRTKNQHISRRLVPGQKTDLSCEIAEQDTTDNKLEIWYDGAEQLEMFLLPPKANQPLGPFPLHTTKTVERQPGRPEVRVYHRNEFDNKDNQIVLRFYSSFVQAGPWGMTLRPLGSNPVDIHAWIESDPGLSAVFNGALKTDTQCTVGSPACSALAIAVSSYDPDDAAKLPGLTAEGPTRNDRKKPDVSAPGRGIQGARSRTNGHMTESGSSMAAPHVAGLVALLMQATAPQLLPISKIRGAVLEHARKNPPPGAGWDSCFGHGRVSALASILSQVTQPPLFINVATSSAVADNLDANPSTPLVASPHDDIASAEGLEETRPSPTS